MGLDIKDLHNNSAFQLGRKVSSGLLKSAPTLRKAGQDVRKSLQPMGETLTRSSELSQVAQEKLRLEKGSAGAQVLDFSSKVIVSGIAASFTGLCVVYALQGQESSNHDNDTIHPNETNVPNRLNKFIKGMSEATRHTNSTIDLIATNIEKR